MKSNKTGLVFALLLTARLAAAAESPQAAPPVPASLSLLDAVRMTLSRQPEIQIAEQSVIASRGALQSAAGQFDVSLQASLSQSGTTVANTTSDVATYGTDRTETYTTQYGVKGSKQFRFGTTVGASVQLSRVAKNITDPAYGQATIVFSVNQPLLRGRGAASVAATETAARYDVEASEHALRQTITEHIRDTALAYWNYLAAMQAVALWQAAQERAELLLAEQQKLVAAGERPAAELSTLSANLAEIQSVRIDTESQSLQARQALGVAMGIDWAAIDKLPPPTGEFLAVESPTLETSTLVALAHKRRPELLAAQVALRSAGVLSRAAQRNLEPQLDFAAQLGYTGLTEGNDAAPFFTPLGDRVLGPNFLASLTLQYPIRNNSARGLLVQRQAAEKQAILQYQNRTRQIGTTVALAVDTLRKAQLGLSTSEAAVVAYRQAVLNEKKKLRAGLATLFDVVLIESRLNSAEQSALSARLRVASAVVQLRYESGTLIEPQGNLSSLTMAQLATAPSAQ